MKLGLGLSFSHRGSGGLGNIEDLFTGDGSELWCPTGEDGTLFQSSGGTGAVTDDDPVGYIGSKGGGVNLLQATSGDRGTWNEGAGLIQMSGSGQHYTAALPSRVSNAYFACIINTNDTAFTLSRALGNGGLYFGVCDDGSSNTTVDQNSGSPSYYVNGSEVASPTRGSLHAAIAVGGKRLVEVLDWDNTASGWANAEFPHAVSALNGNAGDFVVLANPSAASILSARSILAARHSISLS